MTSKPTPDDLDVADRIRATAATVRAPDDLRRRIDRERRVADGRRERRAPRATALAAVTALLLAVALAALPQLRTGASLSLPEAAQVALRAPTSKLPAGSREGPELRVPTIDGVTFPNFEYSALDLRAVGVRQDRSHGHRVVVVSYDDGGARIAYGVVESPALAVPDAARPVTYRGLRFDVLRAGSATVVTWRRDDRTCILASHAASQARLLQVGFTERARTPSGGA
jgi:hypothetical protein